MPISRLSHKVCLFRAAFHESVLMMARMAGCIWLRADPAWDRRLSSSAIYLIGADRRSRNQIADRFAVLEPQKYPKDVAGARLRPTSCASLTSEDAATMNS
jgi:hypothetical protein